MGDKEEKIEYTPDELSEIDRILDILPDESAALEKPAPHTAPGEAGLPDEISFEDVDLGVMEEPEAAKSEELLDITDLLSEVKEPGEHPVPEMIEFPEEILAPPRVPKAATPLDELEALTSLEPASVDMQDLSKDVFTEEIMPAEEAVAHAAVEIPEISEELPELPGEVAIASDLEADIGDLSDIEFGETKEIPEAQTVEIPEIDLGDITLPGEVEAPRMREAGSPAEPTDDFYDASMPSPVDFDQLEPIEGKAPSAMTPPHDEGFGDEGIIGIPKIGEFEEIVKTEEIPHVEEEFAPLHEEPPRGDEEGGAEGFELTEKELKKLRAALLLLNAELRKEIKQTLLNDLLPQKDTRQLVDMIITGKPEDNIRRFLEKKLKKKIEITEEVRETGRRVIAARPEYTKEGAERQKRLMKTTKVFGAAAAIAFVLTVLSYQYIYKPVMAKRIIQQGVALIREPGDPVTKKVQDYNKAEQLFRKVDKDYVKDYIPGYNAYARAYFDKKEYDLARRKLEKALSLDPVSIETLNNLGYFYSRIPDSYYERIRPSGSTETRLDTAIKYYRYVLNRKPNDVTAMYGIGNAYLYQGQHLKARQYFEDIVRVDPKSIVGYSGLINLYIERDALDQVLSIHAHLVDKKMLEETPSALLGKLAVYYLGKKRTDSTNIRIDYGIQSSKYKDLSDNPYPVVRSVLDALHRRDPGYPPQYLLYAKLSQEQKNLALMDNYLKKALKLEPNYFAALHMLGEYHYLVKEPVKAYEYFKKAVKASLSPPEFTFEDFYFETESVGKTYYYMGNIFYYFFDKVRYRFGDELEEEELDADVEEQSNYEIARTKYEMALKEGYESPELSYNLGRIYYMAGQYERALDRWLSLYEDFVSEPEIMFALGNAFYHLDNFEASRGEYLKLISLFERDAEGIRTVVPDRKDHIKIFQSLSSAYNNLGAIYQRKNNETRSSVSYWKAIDYAKRIERENEFARVNLGRAFKQRSEPILPILDENIPYSIGVYSASMR